jgi:hypothetical protein
MTRVSLHHDKDAAFILLYDRKSSAGRLQQCAQLSLDKPILFSRIAHMTQRRPHVQRSAGLTLEEDVIAA